MTPTKKSARSDPPPTFMTIPREMRDRIYYFMFADIEVEVEVISVSKRLKRARCYSSRQLTDTESGPDGGSGVYNSTESSILKTCRQIRAEALEAYYKHSIFTGDPKDIIFWVGRLPLYSRTALRHVRLSAGRGARAHARINALENVQTQALLLNISPGVFKARFYDAKRKVVWASEQPLPCNFDDGPKDQDHGGIGSLLGVSASRLRHVESC